MDRYEYYAQVFEHLQNAFDHSPLVLAQGPELIKRGWNPEGLLVTFEPIENLHDLTVKEGMEVFLPIVGRHKSILAPIDFEIFLSHENMQIYSDPGSQWHFHRKHIEPVSNFFERLMQSYGIPYLLDLTPSGGHVLFHVESGTEAYRELAGIGYLEQELLDACNYSDPTDLKRHDPCGFEAASVFSGIGRLWHYVSLLAKQELRGDEMPITICDSEEKCVNIDNSWQADPAYMRVMRSPYSLHKKNIHKHQMKDASGQAVPPLCDVSRTFYDGANVVTCPDLKDLVECMWDFERAVDHSRHFTGHIPVANDNLVALIRDYKRTRLYELMCDFDSKDELHVGEALSRAVHDDRLSEKSRHVLAWPNPRLMQPNVLKKFVADLIDSGWHPRHIGSLINDIYVQGQYNWHTNWLKYTSRTRANYWARAYASVHLFEAGVRLLDPSEPVDEIALS
ncbi:MAG: hypothetical protein HY815_24690 [Candidatus Riflebacteria bacterium]|nr:hypothetical protein [Candidatus Riflebacteria bacterium]